MDEIAMLRTEVEKTSQAEAGRKISYSPTVVNLVLSGKYTGDMDKVRKRIRQRLKPYIACPVLGEITHTKCDTQRNLPFSAASSERVRLFKACKSCPFNTQLKGN